MHASAGNKNMLWIICGILLMDAILDSSRQEATWGEEWGLQIGLNLNLSSTGTSVALDPIRTRFWKY